MPFSQDLIHNQLFYLVTISSFGVCIKQSAIYSIGFNSKLIICFTFLVVAVKVESICSCPNHNYWSLYI